MNTASKLATTWFGDKERGVATAFGGLSMPVGCIIGFAMPALMITEGDSKDKFIQFLIVQNIIVSIPTIPTLIFAKEKPDSPPSAAASRKDETMNLV